MVKHKKFSSAILCGFRLVDGRQHFGDYWNHEDGALRAVCVLGAARLCLTGEPEGDQEVGECTFAQNFRATWGIYPTDLNDEGMPWEHIYGMARAAGL